MISFLIFVFVMSFTPGPNTIMAMVSGQNDGIKKSVPLNLGMLGGLVVIGALASIFASWIQSNETFVLVMKVVGSLYLAYLTYHVLISVPGSEDEEAGGFMTGFLIQMTNVKVYLYFITGLGAFTLAGIWGHISVRLVLMVLIGSLGTFTWTILGQAINGVYKKHYRVFNVAISLLLVLSIVDLWR